MECLSCIVNAVVHRHTHTHTLVTLIIHSHSCTPVARSMNKKLHLLIKEATDTYT